MQPLYLDAALLMYYLQCRPVDIVLFREDMIFTTKKGNKAVSIIPRKKRTYRNATAQTQSLPLANEALEIIKKYKGQSKGGYVLPFPMNETYWDISTRDGFKAWNKRKSKVLGNIDAHLKKVGKLIGLNFPLTLYVLRRSVITHKLNNGENPMQVAKRSGTSIAMLSRHYYKDAEF